MELLGFLLAAMAIAFVISKLIFDRATQKPSKNPKDDAEWKAFM